MSNFLKNLSLHINILNKQKKELNSKISLFSDIIIKTFENNGKLMVIGNGGSAADAQHLTTELTVRMSKNRIALPALALTTDTSALTAISNDYNFNKVFSRQVEALGSSEDLLLSISTSGNSENVVKATNVANEMKVNTLTICGYDGGRLKQVSKNSVWIRSNDMQLCEDAQTVFGHMVMKSLCGKDLFV